MQETKDKLANLAKTRQDAKEAIAESQRPQKHFADKSSRDVTFEASKKTVKTKGPALTEGPGTETPSRA
jgi:hypothetical protein